MDKEEREKLMEEYRQLKAKYKRDTEHFTLGDHSNVPQWIIEMNRRLDELRYILGIPYEFP